MKAGKGTGGSAVTLMRMSLPGEVGQGLDAMARSAGTEPATVVQLLLRNKLGCAKTGRHENAGVMVRRKEAMALLGMTSRVEFGKVLECGLLHPVKRAKVPGCARECSGRRGPYAYYDLGEIMKLRGRGTAFRVTQSSRKN